MYADIFITAVMTGVSGQNGMSVILVHKDTPGFSVRKIDIRGADLSGACACNVLFGSAIYNSMVSRHICRHRIFGFSKCGCAFGPPHREGK